MREIDQELKRLDKWERAATGERAVLLSARAALAAGTGAHRGRVSQADVTSYLTDHPGSWPAQIADARQTSTTNVSNHLLRGRYTRYEHRGDGWYLRSGSGGEV